MKGNATIEGNGTVGGGSFQRAFANGCTLSGETSPARTSGAISSLRAGAGVSLTIDTSTNVVTVNASLANYGSGAGVQYLLDTTNQAIHSLLLGNSVAFVNSGAGSVIVNYEPYIASPLFNNIASTTSNRGQIVSNITLQTGRAGNSMYTFSFPAAHPNGAKYMVMVMPNIEQSIIALDTCAAKVENST